MLTHLQGGHGVEKWVGGGVGEQGENLRIPNPCHWNGKLKLGIPTK